MNCYGCDWPISGLGFTLSICNSEMHREDVGFCFDCTRRLFDAIDDCDSTFVSESMFLHRATVPDARAVRAEDL